MHGRLCILILSTGWGILVLPIVFGCMVMMSVLLDTLTPSPAPHRYLDISLGMILAAIILWPLGCCLNHQKPYWEQHTLFFIPIQLWSALFIILGGTILFTP